MNADRIEKTVVLHVPHARAWHAISNSQEFGKWFGIRFNGEFIPDAQLHGRFTHPGSEHLTADIEIEKVEPEHLLSWRWHPHAIDPKKDYSEEPMTLVVFELEEVTGGTRLTVIESGFDKLPEERREEAYQGNESGWIKQLDSIKRYLLRAA